MMNIDLLSGHARLVSYFEIEKGTVRFAVKIKDDEVTVDPAQAQTLLLMRNADRK